MIIAFDIFVPAVVKVLITSSIPPAPLKKLLNADFALFIEPLIVVEASFAVVPVTSNSSWITWIALNTSFKLEISYLTPDIFSASASNLSISVFVPPYTC